MSYFKFGIFFGLNYYRNLTIGKKRSNFRNFVYAEEAQYFVEQNTVFVELMKVDILGKIALHKK